ncbi:MAG: ParB N-terminal domain-containing protein, partial [Parvularcula sp.]|nr:ParB N-terminal domain-containing protein [Parvularcula sp.]
MTYETYPLSALAIAAENVRHASRADDGIPALAQLIADSGLQQPLCGYKKGRTKLLIYDGRRRLLALQHLAREDRLPKDCLDGIPCRIGSKAEARAASLGAGLGAKGFHP